MKNLLFVLACLTALSNSAFSTDLSDTTFVFWQNSVTVIDQERHTLVHATYKKTEEHSFMPLAKLPLSLDASLAERNINSITQLVRGEIKECKIDASTPESVDLWSWPLPMANNTVESHLLTWNEQDKQLSNTTTTKKETAPIIAYAIFLAYLMYMGICKIYSDYQTDIALYHKIATIVYYIALMVGINLAVWHAAWFVWLILSLITMAFAGMMLTDKCSQLNGSIAVLSSFFILAFIADHLINPYEQYLRQHILELNLLCLSYMTLPFALWFGGRWLWFKIRPQTSVTTD